MFGFDWPELIIIGIVALIFIGPEDLPDMFRQLGRFTAKLRQMSREFSRAMEQAAKDTGVSDVARDLKNTTSMKSMGLDKVREAADKFEKWDPIKNAAKPTATMPARTLTPPPMPPTPAPVALTPTTAAERDAAAWDAAGSGSDVSPLDAAAVTAAGAGADVSAIKDEVEDDLAALAEDEAEAAAAKSSFSATPPQHTVHGPATQALYDKQALRAKVFAEQTEKLKAIEAGTYQADPPAAAAPVEAPAPRKRTSKAKAETVKALDTAAAGAETKAEPSKKTSRKKKADNA